MHVAHDALAAEQYDKIFRDKAYGLLFHGLRNPHTAVLCHSYFAPYNANVGSVEVLRPINGVGIAVGNGYFGQTARKHLCFGIEALDNTVYVVAGGQVYHMAAHILAHGYKLRQRIVVLNTLQSAEVGHVILPRNLHIAAVS